MSELLFPELPPWPPCWAKRQAYLHWWLCFFMTGVGALKAAGFLRHDLSQIVGVLEFLGGAILLPRWSHIIRFLGKGGAELSLRMGCWFILGALGMIVSTRKRKSPVCWSQTVLCLELLRVRGGNSAVGIGVVMLLAGTILGFVLQTFKEKSPWGWWDHQTFHKKYRGFWTIRACHKKAPSFWFAFKDFKSTILKVRLVSGSLSRSQHHPIDQETSGTKKS